MKRFSLFASVILLVCAYACQLETEFQPENSGFKTVTINAGDAGTRTEVQFDGVNYSVKWKAGDQIRVAEVIEANFGGKGGPDPYQIVTSSALPADVATASFTVELADRTSPEENPHGDQFKYVGVYPAGGLYGVNWTGNEKQAWEERWGNTTTPDHFTVLVELPTGQNPTADSFDPAADLMVSSVVTSSTQPTSLSMHFARVGTIAKITLTGLPVGKKVESGTFYFPLTFPGSYIVEYDPVLGGTGVYFKSAGQIRFNPTNVIVDGEGNAVIWLRTLSGVLDDWFKFEVNLIEGEGGGKGDKKGKGGESEYERYERRVELTSYKPARSITFPESGIVTFSVGMEKYYGLVMDLESHEETENTVTLNMHYDIGEMPHTSVTYGLIRIGAEAEAETVTLASAAPGDIIYLEPDGDGKVSYTDSGLSPNTIYRYKPFINIDGTGHYPDNYVCLSLQTLEHFDYPVPELVDLGLPSGTKWATYNLGSNDPLTAGYYFKWGEVRPADISDNYYYGSKYWNQYRWYNTGYANKYSVVAGFGQDGLVDMNTVLDAADDAATVCLGGEWRTPTAADFGELFENCTRTSVDGGYKYTSNIEGYTSRFIIFPACGYYSGSTNETLRTFMMTSSLNCEEVVNVPNRAICSDVSIGMSEYIDGSTRGYMKCNVRPVSGGTRAGYVWTAHTSVTVHGSGSATVYSENLKAEDLTKYQSYTYKAHLTSDPSSYYPATDITRNGSHTYTGLTPGTTYYYYVSWECREIANPSYGHYGNSEVRSFVAE